MGNGRLSYIRIPVRSDPKLFRFPIADQRTCIIGATGSGKTTCGVWLLTHQRFDMRPWIIFDYKREILFEKVGTPPLQELRLGKLPRKGKKGVYLVSPRPDQDDAVEDMLWSIWHRGNIGVYIDEAALIPKGDAMRAILQQGRSKLIPVIALTQRPVDVDRRFFSEANFYAVFRLADARDYDIVRGFVPAEFRNPLPEYWWRWYDNSRNNLLTMRPVPAQAEIVSGMKGVIPFEWHPFRWW